MPIQLSNVLLICQACARRRGPDAVSRGRCEGSASAKSAARASAKFPRPRRVEPEVAVANHDPRLLTRYNDQILAALQTGAGRDNRLSLPRLKNRRQHRWGCSAISEKHLEEAADAMTLITGQSPWSRSRDRSPLPLREGACHRLQGHAPRPAMFEFLDRLISIAIPSPRLPRLESDVRRVRQLQPGAHRAVGVSGIESRQVRARRMNITLVTTTDSNDEQRCCCGLWDAVSQGRFAAGS